MTPGGTGSGRRWGAIAALMRRRGVPRLRRQPLWRSAGFLQNLPRGAGVIASLLYLGAWGAFGMVSSGRTAEVLNEATAELGFRITAVRITGQREVDEADILDTLAIRSGQSLFLYDAAAARDRLAAMPWIADVSVMKLYPDKLRVIIEERIPAALWQRSIDDPVSIIDGEGSVITSRLEERFTRLPRVMGEGAERRVHEIAAILEDAPELKARVRASMLVSNRRWDLFLDNGVQVMLPEIGAPEAAIELAGLEARSRLLDRDLKIVDMRLPDRMVVRLGEAAKAARDALTGAREKALKQLARDA